VICSLELTSPKLRATMAPKLPKDEGRARLDEQVDVLAVEADHLRVVVGNFESEMVDIKKGSFLRIWGLNQKVCTKAVCHVIPREEV
jgi:hypothetical protein